MPGPGGRMGGPGGHYMTEEEKKAQPKITKDLVTRVFSYLKPYWKQFSLAISCIGISSIFIAYLESLIAVIIESNSLKDSSSFCFFLDSYSS